MRKAVIVGIYRAVPGRWQREPGGTRGVSLLSRWGPEDRPDGDNQEDRVRSLFLYQRNLWWHTDHDWDQLFSPKALVVLTHSQWLTVAHSGVVFLAHSPGLTRCCLLLPSTLSHCFLWRWGWAESEIWMSEGHQGQDRAIKKGNQEWSLTSQTEIWKDLRPSAEYFKSPSKEYPLWFGTGYNLSRYLC